MSREREFERLARIYTVQELNQMALGYLIGLGREGRSGTEISAMKRRYHTLQKAIELGRWVKESK